MEQTIGLYSGFYDHSQSTLPPKKRYDNKSMKKLFKWLLLLVIAVAISIVVVIYNPNIIKGLLERNLSRVAGYPISLRGDLVVSPGRMTELTANHVHISAPGWAAHQDLVAVEHLQLSILTSTLFEDIIVIDFLKVDKLELNLETNSEGKGNWLTVNKPKTESKGTRPAIIFKTIAISDTTTRFRNGRTDVENVLHIASLDKRELPDGMLHTQLIGDLNTRPVEATFTMGPYANLVDGKNINFTVDGHFGELNVVGGGLVDDLLQPRQPVFDIDLKGPNTDEITAMLGIEDLGGGAFSLRAKGGPVNGNYEADINGKVGDISLSVTAQASEIARFHDLDLDLAINGPSLGSLTRVFGLKHWPDKPFSLTGQAARVGATLDVRNLTLNIGGTKLLLDALMTEFPTLEGSRVKLTISGDDVKQFHDLIGIKGPATGPFNIVGKIDATPEGLELLQVKLDTSLGHVTVSGPLGEAPDYIGSKLDLHIDGQNANLVMTVFGIDMLPERPFNMNARVEVAEGGLHIERGVLVTIEDERLELGGFVAFGSGSIGTDVDMKISGKHFAEMIRRHVRDTELPDSPYELSGQIKLQEEGIRLENMVFGYEGITLTSDGLIKPGDQLLGTALNFQIGGKDLSSLNTFKAIGTSLDVFVPGQPYQFDGRFSVGNDGWKLNGVKGRIGKTDLNFDALISKQAELSGSNIRFLIQGSDLNNLLRRQSEPGLPAGPFESSGMLDLRAQTLAIKDFRLKSTRASGEVDLEIDWPLNKNSDVSFNVNLQGEDIRRFIPRTKLFEAEKAEFQLKAAGSKQGDLLKVDQFDSTIGNMRISLTAKADDNPDDDDIDVAFSVLSEDISTLGKLKGKSLPAQSLDLKAEFKGNAGQFVLNNLVGSLGESNINGELAVSLKGNKPDIKLNASSRYIDIRPYLGEKKVGDKAPATTKPDRLIPAIPLPLDTLAAADISIVLNVDELRYRQASITNLSLGVEQQAGSLKLKEFFYEAPRGILDASLSVEPVGPNKANVKIDLNTEDYLINLSGLTEDRLSQVPAFDVDFHATGTGGTLREVAGTLNGSLYMASKGGNAENIDLSILETFILDELFSVLMPKSESTLEPTQINCVATNIDITDGLLKTKPALAFTSDKIAVITKGTVDLKTEKMNLNFNSTPTNALKINAGEMFYPYILISGTLADPKVGVDPGKAALHGGAAIATMGISVLAKGLIDRASNAAPLCESMLNNPPKKP